MDNSNTVCPVCTLYLREGVTLQAHLDTHPKEQVIEALLKVSNEGSCAQASQTPSTSTSSFGPLQSYANSNGSFISQASPYINPQTQMTTAVTYQHFMASNGSAVMPQYIHVPTIINPNANIPVISNQTVDFVPNQTMNYSQTVYNPLYNPYIPHPYPFTQPVYTSFPMSTTSGVDSNTQTNHTLSSNTADGFNEVVTLRQPNSSVKKCSVATNTEVNKKISKKIGIKKTIYKHAISKKVKNFKQKLSDSSKSYVIVKSTEKNSKNSSKFGIIKKSIIKTVRPKISSKTLLGLNSGIISPPPLTPIIETSIKSLSGSKTPPPPPLAVAPNFSSEMLSFVKSENIPDSSGVGASSAIISSSNTFNNDVRCLEPDQKLNTVIVNSNTLVLQDSNNEVQSNKEDSEKSEFIAHSVDTVLENDKNGKKLDTKSFKIPLSIEVDDVNIELEDFNEEEQYNNSEKQGKVFQMIDIETEGKISETDTTINQDIPKKINSKNIERNCDGSDIFIQEENISFNEDLERQKRNENSSCLEYIEPESGILTSKENSFYNKELNNLTAVNSYINKDCISKQSELQPMTYTDLQPAKSSRVFEDLGLPTSFNFNNFMEVDGIKIIFNNSASTVPFDPLVKLTRGIQTDGRNITTFMKTENQISSHTLVDSVIHLMSGSTESKNELTFEDSYTPTTSKLNDIQLDLQNLSPIALNIQADESMPARGELSEQESLGAENSTWNLFHDNSTSNIKTIEEWRNECTQNISVIGSKKGTKSFKCSTCNEVFWCPKERRVHKNTVHLTKISKAEKVSSSSKKTKNYICSFCNEPFTCLRDRKAHIAQNHHRSFKNKKINNQIEEENIKPEFINLDETDAPVKHETEQENIKTETSLPSIETDSHRVKYCARCSLPFVGIKKLREHLRLVHGEIRFKCETCSACFDEEPEFNDHLLIHPLVCDKCGKTFHKKPNLNLHMKRHLDVKPYECTLCPKSFITRQKLEEHMNGHSGKKPLKCTLCDKTFSRHSNLIQHRNLHHLNVKKKIKDFVCRCGEVFHSLRKLEWHKEVHEPKPKPCPFCSQKFIHSASVTRHIRRAHLPDYLPGDNREFDNVQCPICEKVYLRSSLVVHMRVHNGEKPFACKICNKRFSTKWNLELHSWTHQSRSNMPFKCQICKSAFFRESDFVAHLNSHRNYKPFTCNICGQKFIRKYSCLRHQEEHKKSKQFVCAVNGCAKSFHRGYYLRDHMKVHTGVRPHTCHICGKASSTKSNHNKHVRIHDTREPINTEN